LVRLFAPLLFLLSFATAEGQYYEHVYGGSNSVTPVFSHLTADGGLIVAGNFVDTNHITGFYLMRTDRNGHQLWSQSYNDGFNSYTRSVTVGNDGNIYLVGSHEGPIYQTSAEVIVFDTAGTILNNEFYPPLSGWGTNGVGICNKSDSTVAIIVFNNGVVSSNFYSVYSLDSALAVTWNDFVGIDDAFTTEHGIAGNSGGVYTISYYDNFFYSTPPLFNVTHVRRHKNSGALTLDSLYEFDCQTSVIAPAYDGGALIAGNKDTLSQLDVALFRLDSMGNVLWQKRYGTGLMDIVSSVTMTADSGFVILATSDDSLLPGQHDMWLLKINSNGDSLWSRRFGSTLDEHALNIAVDQNDIVMTGNTTGSGTDHIYVVRTDSLGLIPKLYSISVNGRYFCIGDTATFQLNPSPDSTVHIQWSTGDTLNPLQVTSTGNYFAVVTDTNGVSVQTNFTAVYFAQDADATFAPDTISLCYGTIFEDTSNNDISDVYQWYLNGSPLIGENLNYYQPGQKGLYSLTVKNYCNSDSAHTLLDTIYANPVVPNIIPAHTGLVCVGDSVQLSFAGNQIDSYQWYFDDKIISFATDTQCYAAFPGNFSVIASNINGCSVESFPFLVQFDDYNEYINPNGPTAFCSGGEISLSVSAGSNYLWSNGDTTQLAVADSSGDYYVNFTDVYGCHKYSDTLVITVLPEPVLNIGNDTLVCSGSTLLLDAGPGFGNYLWSDNSTNQTLLLEPVSPFPDTNNIIVFVVDSNNCPGSDTARVIFDICAATATAEDQNIAVYPTLIHSGERIHINTSLLLFTFELFDIIGHSVVISNKNEPDVSRLSSGSYTYKLTTGSVVVSTGHIIIE
jgi:hypothetical protein